MLALGPEPQRASRTEPAGPTKSSSRQPPWGLGAQGEEISFGTWLRRQREIREIPMREIADVTKISIRYLEALEADRFDVLPAPVFAKGFLREYSRYVGLDPDEVVNSYLIAQQSPEEPTGTPKSNRSYMPYGSEIRTSSATPLALSPGPDTP